MLLSVPLAYFLYKKNTSQNTQYFNRTAFLNNVALQNMSEFSLQLAYETTDYFFAQNV